MSTRHLIKGKPADELENTPAKSSIRCCDVLVLAISFLFTILVASLVVLYVNNYRHQNSIEIERIVEKILDDRARKATRETVRGFERKRGYLHEGDREKRAASNQRFPSTTNVPIVEFFNPKLRRELEKNDSAIMEKTGAKGAAPNGDSWVWLTAYSRIPFEAIEGFCRETKDYCPPGPIGSPGSDGEKGPPGEKGPTGPRGASIRGEKGDKGFRGQKGDRGGQGLDGRDGIPGEPGMDGKDGRPGTDGKHGIDGIDGDKGSSGKDGLNGTKGEQGPMGARGLKGEKGLVGPQGKKGVRGTDGLNGAPGTRIYSLTKENETSPYDYWIPASIPISTTKSKPIVVNEGDNLRLQCAATGVPPPMIVWSREDGSPLDSGKWKDNSKISQSINITSINRIHMGSYMCAADNGITPVAKYTFHVEVHFKPIVRITKQRDQSKGHDIGASVTFTCESEAYPEPVLYWERAPDNLVINNDTYKYRIESHPVHAYMFNSSLTINGITKDDYGEYYCVSKNTLGLEKIVFRLGTRGQYGRISDGDKPVVSGETPPVVSYEDVCPPQDACPFCPEPSDLKCKDASLSLKDLTGGMELEVKPVDNSSYPALANRSQDCELNMVGKPVFHHFLDMEHGAWLRDAIQKDNITNEKIWLTKENERNLLYEYKNREDYRRNKPSRNHPYKLMCAFTGNAHIIYGGYFYYYCNDQAPKLIRYDLRTEKAEVIKPLENINTTQYLYTTQFNIIDFSADDNGLWIIHATPESNHTIVSKLNETSLEITNSLNISVQHNKVGEMFIACGILYAVDSATLSHTKIRFALDLYTAKLLEIEILFTNPFNGTTSIGYNHNTKEIYTWNLGNQLTYPVRIIALGTNVTAEEPIEKLLAVGSTKVHIRGN